MRASIKAKAKDCNVHKGREREKNVRDEKKIEIIDFHEFSIDGDVFQKIQKSQNC